MNLDLNRSQWNRVNFGDVVEQSKEKVDPTDGTICRVVAGENMDSNDLKIHRWGSVDNGYLGPAFHRRFRPGQVLYGSRRTYLRKVAVADFDGVCANTTFVLSSKVENQLLTGFLPWVMTSEPFHAFAIAESKGSVNPYVNFSDLAKYEFDLPPLDQQQRIADILWAAERARQSSMRLMESSNRARLSWIEGRFTEFLRESSKPFQDYWRMGPQSGVSAPPVDRPTGHFVLSLAALGENGYREGQLKSVDRTEKMASATLNSGDLLISRANTVDLVGRAAIFLENRRDVSFPDTMMRIDLDGKVLPEFIALVVMSPHGRAHMRKTAAGTNSSMAKINRTSLGSLLIPDLSLTDQRSILDEVAIFDRSISRLETELEAQSQLRRLFSAAVFGEDSK